LWGSSSLLPLERRKVLLLSCMEFRQHLCLQRSQSVLNINFNLFINLFQAQCNMEHEWLPKESLEGILANLFLWFTIVIALSWPNTVLIECKHSHNKILKRDFCRLPALSRIFVSYFEDNEGNVWHLSYENIYSKFFEKKNSEERNRLTTLRYIPARRLVYILIGIGRTFKICALYNQFLYKLSRIRFFRKYRVK